MVSRGSTLWEVEVEKFWGFEMWSLEGLEMLQGLRGFCNARQEVEVEKKWGFEMWTLEG